MSDHNRLTSGLKEYIGPQQFQKALEQFPPSPEEVRKLPPLVRANVYLDQINNLFLLGPSQFRTADMIQRMIMSYYRAQDPADPTHVNRYYSKKFMGYTKPIGSIVHGQPGVGKSIGISQALMQYPQIIEHNDFPHFNGKYQQVVWFSVSIKSHTRKGFATELAEAWNNIFLRHNPSQLPPIPQSEINKANTDQLFALFLQSAIAHNLGFIHIDELQTLFRLALGKSSGKQPTDEISVRDDIPLGKILGMFNTGIPILISCTSDGLEGLIKRGAVSQRVGLNNIAYDRFKSADDESYIRLIKVLMRYQYTDLSIPFTRDILELIHLLSAGIYRIIIYLYIEAQRNVLMMGKSCIGLNDLRSVHGGLSDDIKKTIQALHNQDRKFLSSKPDYRFEKL